MRGHGLGSLVLLLTTGCSPHFPPIPDDEPFSDVVADLSFGMFAADLIEHRPESYLSGDGTRRETVFDREISYVMTPKDPDRPAPPTARLVGVASRREYWDTLELRAEWTRLLHRYSVISGTSPECAQVSDRPSTWTRALFDGPVVRRLTAQVFRAPDGQHFEAFLVARIGVGAFEEAEGENRTWTKADCPTVGPEE